MDVTQTNKCLSTDYMSPDTLADFWLFTVNRPRLPRSWCGQAGISVKQAENFPCDC